MSLESDYELLEVLRDDGVQSFRAKEVSTGRSLEVHLFLPFGRPENKILFERLKGLPLESRRAFLDVGADGSTPFIVTDPLPEIRGFREWVETLFVTAKPEAFSTPAKPEASVTPAKPEASSPSSAKAPPVTTKSPGRPPERDESVQILQAGQWRTGTPLPQALVTPPQPAPPPLLPPSLASVEETFDQTGEFTGLFQSSFQTAPPEPKPEPESEPGEFTKLFKNSLSAPKPAPAVNPGTSGQAGEFTRLFDSPLQPAPLGQSYPEARVETSLPRTAAPAPAQPGSEFTQMFGGSSSTRETPPPPGSLFVPPPGSPFVPPPPPGTGGGGPAAGYGSVPSATGAFSSGGQFASAPPPRSSSGPSEYTRMMSAPVQPAPGPTQPVAPPSSVTPAATAPKSNVPLFLVLGVLVLLAVAVVIYFLLSHR